MVDIQVNTDSNNDINIEIEASQGNASVILDEQSQIINQIGTVALYGPAGRGIVKTEKTGTEGLVDTYTIFYTDNTTSTYTVTNGRDGHTLTYVHEQGIASDTWTIQHNLSKYPSVTLVDSANVKFQGKIEYVDENTCIVYMNGATKGKAYLN